jgi:putative transposase
MTKHHVKLRKKDREYLEALVARGKLSAKVFKRATGLLELERGKTLQAVAETLGVSSVTVAAWREKYQAHGVQCLEDAPRSGRPIEIDGVQRAKLTALACSDAPTGQWRGVKAGSGAPVAVAIKKGDEAKKTSQSFTD